MQTAEREDQTRRPDLGLLSCLQFSGFWSVLDEFHLCGFLRKSTDPECQVQIPALLPGKVTCKSLPLYHRWVLVFSILCG